MATHKSFSVGDKVKRISNPTSCKGTVKEVREETMQSGDSREKDRPVIVSVLWDNGTQSSFGPAGLEKVKD